MRILIIEDELDLLRDLSHGLELKGYAVDQAETGSIGFQMAMDEDYDLIVLDLNLPGMSGLEVLSRLRTEKPETKLTGFELGASDYLTKPFHFEELEARIRVLLNRKFIQESNLLRYHDLSMDTLKREVTVKGEPLPLTAKEMAILEYFLLNRERLISQQEIIEHVWNGDSDPFSNSIRVHLSALRKKLKSALGSDPIRTKIGEGYIFS